MDGQSFREARWLAVYGAFVAVQAQRKMDEGLGAPDDDDVKRYVEEATTLADMAAAVLGDPTRGGDSK